MLLMTQIHLKSLNTHIQLYIAKSESNQYIDIELSAEMIENLIFLFVKSFHSSKKMLF